MKCAHCFREVENGVVRRGQVFCGEHCAEEDRRDMADLRANREGFASYEDMAEHYGVTVIE